MSGVELTLVLTAIAIAAAIITRQLVAVRQLRASADGSRFASEIIDNAGEGIIVYDRGRFSPQRENGVHHFHMLYAALMNGEAKL